LLFFTSKLPFSDSFPDLGRGKVNLKLLFHSVPPDHQPCDRQKKPDEGHEEVENNAG